MIDFEKIEQIREDLVFSLVKWREHWEDGLYRSNPEDTGPKCLPSYTNTAIAIQAFNEAGKVQRAQVVSNYILQILSKNPSEPLPSESNPCYAHVLANSWAMFSVLDCYPSLIEPWRELCKWFLGVERNGWWDFVPSEPLDYPIFSAYSLSALAQYLDCSLKLNVDDDLAGQVRQALKRGTHRLLNARLTDAKARDVLLWPLKTSDADGYDVSFGTSALCMHVLAKTARVLREPKVDGLVVRTLCELIDSFERVKTVDQNNYKYGKYNVGLWHTVHTTACGKNYMWAFFAPLHLVTVLRYGSQPEFCRSKRYYQFVETFVDWIVDHTSDCAGHIGIQGSNSIADVKLWSTAEAVISLSRVLASRDALHMTEYETGLRKPLRTSRLKARTHMGKSPGPDPSLEPPIATTKKPKPMPLAKGHLTLKDIRGKVDIGILTVRIDEFQVILDRFPDHRTATGGKNIYEFSEIKVPSGVQRVAIARTVEQGQGVAQATARSFLDDLNPPWLFLVGIAGGMPSNEFSLGDVVLAVRLHDFSVTAAIQRKAPELSIGGGSMHPDVNALLANLPAQTKALMSWYSPESLGSKIPREKIPHELTDKFRNDKLYGSESWQRGVHTSLKAHFSPTGKRSPLRFWAGAVASSNTLLKNAHVAKRWRESARDTAAVEMELAGVYQAVLDGGRRKSRLLAIRGVSDIVGFQRDPKWTQFACHSAASFAHALIASGIIRSVGSRSHSK